MINQIKNKLVFSLAVIFLACFLGGCGAEFGWDENADIYETGEFPVGVPTYSISSETYAAQVCAGSSHIIGVSSSDTYQLSPPTSAPE